MKMDEYRNLANSGQDSRTKHVKINTVVVLTLIRVNNDNNLLVFSLEGIQILILEGKTDDVLEIFNLIVVISTHVTLLQTFIGSPKWKA